MSNFADRVAKLITEDPDIESTEYSENLGPSDNSLEDAGPDLSADVGMEPDMEDEGVQDDTQQMRALKKDLVQKFKEIPPQGRRGAYANLLRQLGQMVDESMAQKDDMDVDKSRHRAY